MRGYYLVMIKFITRFIDNLLMLLFCTLPLQLVGMIVLLIIVPTLSRSVSKLPDWLAWFDNAENIYLDENDPDRDGLSGPSYYRRDDLGIANAEGPFDGNDDIALFRLWWNRYNWLALRNPINYFQYEILGAKIDEDDVVIIKGTDTNHYAEVITQDDLYYEYYVTKPWLFGFIFRFRMGWKITSTYRPIQQSVFIINPFAKQV